MELDYWKQNKKISYRQECASPLAKAIPGQAKLSAEWMKIWNIVNIVVI